MTERYHVTENSFSFSYEQNDSFMMYIKTVDGLNKYAYWNNFIKRGHIESTIDIWNLDVFLLWSDDAISQN